MHKDCRKLLKIQCYTVEIAIVSIGVIIIFGLIIYWMVKKGNQKAVIKETENLIL